MVTNNGLGSFGDALLAAAGAMLEADAEKVRTEPKVAVGDRLLHANGAVDRVLAIDGRMATLERIGKGAGYTHPGSKTTLPIADIHATLEFKGATVDTSGRAKQPDAATPAHAARGPSDAALDTTGTGIPTVETHDAIDKTGPSVEQPAPVVAATQATDATGAKEGPSLNAAIRDAKAERAHIAARIRPEADEQVDGKGRTLVEIDAALEDVFEELASYARRTENLERLLAARVSNPCEPSKATGENELATDIMCADRQRFLASVCDSCRAVVRAMLSKGDIPGVVKTNQS